MVYRSGVTACDVFVLQRWYRKTVRMKWRWWIKIDRNSRQISKKDGYFVFVDLSMVAPNIHQKKTLQNPLMSQLSTRKSCNTQKLQGADVNRVNQPLERLAILFCRGHSGHTTPQHVEEDYAWLNSTELTSNLQWCCWLLGVFFSSWNQVEDLVGFKDNFYVCRAIYAFEAIHGPASDFQKLLPKSIYMDALPTLIGMRWCDYRFRIWYSNISIQ